MAPHIELCRDGAERGVAGGADFGEDGGEICGKTFGALSD